MLETIGATGVYAIIGVITLAIASLVGLVLFASKEETFEDVVAAQKKEQEALLNSLQGTTKSGKPNKKWNKLKSKKATKKENEEGLEVDSGVDDDEPSSESVAVPPTKVEEERVSKRVSKKQKKEAESIDSVNESSKAKPEKPKKQKKVKKVIEEEVVSQSEQVAVESANSGPIEDEILVSSEEISVNAEPELFADPPPPMPKEVESTQKKSKSTKSKPAKNSAKPKGGSILSTEKLVKDIENAQLNSSEVQQVIDLLLAKQNENEQWKKPNQKGDPMEQLKKQVSDLDIQLMEERKNAQTVAHKNKDLRLELQQERHQKQSLQAQVASRLAQQAKENEMLRKRMEEQHISETQSTQTQIQRMQELIDGASQIELQHLKEENSHLKNASMRAQQLSEDNKSLMNELAQLKQGNKQIRQDLENSRLQFQQVEQQYQNAQRVKSETENAISQRLQEVNEQLLKVESQNRNLTHELQQSKNDNQQAKVELETLQHSAPSSSDELLQLNTKLSDAQTKLMETESTLNNFHVQLGNKNKELLKYQSDLNEAHKTLSEKDNSFTETLGKSSEKDKQIAELTKKAAELEHANEEMKNNVTNNQVNGHAGDEQLKTLDETVENLKKKNNDLREKNWKAVDALGKAEEESQNKSKSIQKNLMKGLKQLNPDVKLPEYDDNALESFFTNYVQNCSVSIKQKSDEKLSLQEENARLAKEIELKSASNPSSNSEELARIQTENASLKNVLGETESMLSRLQAGVDAEVGKWQKKVEEKDHEIEDDQKRIAELEEVLKEHGFVKESVSQESINSTPSKKKKHGFSYTLSKIIHPKMEHTLKETQQQLEQEKNENKKLREDLESSEARQKESPENKEVEGELKTIKEQLEVVKKELEEKQSAAETEVNDLNGKLKKTISERDLLIREYKSLKDNNCKAEEECKKVKEEREAEQKRQCDEHAKEVKKANDQVTALENASKSSGKGDKEKDKLIGKLYLEIEELKDDLREERDRVIVDIETPDSEELHKQVDALEHDKLNLSAKLNDLEKSYQEEQSDKDKVLNLESKLKAAEAKIQELESVQTAVIQNQIEDAMQPESAASIVLSVGTTV